MLNEAKCLDVNKNTSHITMENFPTYLADIMQPGNSMLTSETPNTFPFMSSTSFTNDISNLPFYINSLETIQSSTSASINTTADDCNSKNSVPTTSSSDNDLQKFYLHLLNIFNVSRNIKKAVISEVSFSGDDNLLANTPGTSAEYKGYLPTQRLPQTAENEIYQSTNHESEFRFIIL
uniref:Uncharacterized protein n=1 Tax=Trichobilharzia regenti TaxID=157069 RepID=A0AA85J7Q0_TRIRE|nr:unnamed protein product [Trichobilharzia regenti]